MTQVQEIVLRAGIRLPRSSPRGCRDCFVKLLSSVDPDATHAFGFEGRYFRAGSLVSLAALRPGPEYPETPVVLEYATLPAPGRHRRDSVYILWRWDAAAGEWRELARSICESWQWASDLRPVAVRALKEARSAAVLQIVPDVRVVAARIAEVLERELRGLEPHDRFRVVSLLHDRLAARLCA
jgi:hypothetical protein